jgi:glycosyltransferase involved in cell wall biosynthesis
VTRFSAIKDPLNLVEAFIITQDSATIDGGSAKLVMIGDGELHEQAVARLRQAGRDQASWLPGSRDDIPEQLRAMDVFVLGSLREGISNTVLEAMASGLPVIASDTGGNRELIEDGVNGALVRPGDRDALARAISTYLREPDLRVRHGRASRDRAVSLFSIQTMVDYYRQLYQSALGTQGS